MKTCCDTSLELSRWDGSNVGHKIRFYGRIIWIIIINYPCYTFLSRELKVTGFSDDIFCELITDNCTARQCSPLRRKFKACSINNPALSLLMKHLVIGQGLKTPNFSAFHWSPRGSLVSIGQHFVATKIIHLPKSTETSLITESDQSGPKHQLLQLRS